MCNHRHALCQEFIGGLGHPAEAARELGMHKVPLLCAREIDVPGGMPMCIRILLHLNTEKRQQEIVHVYLRDARKLRPDMNSAQ